MIPSVGSGSLAPSTTSALTNTLTQFNEGTLGPPHCIASESEAIERPWVPALPPDLPITRVH